MMDEFIVVVEPGARSVQTYHQIVKLAGDRGVKTVRVVGNKIRTPEDEAFIRESIPRENLLGMVHYSEDVAASDRAGRSPYDYSRETVSEIQAIKALIDRSTDKK